MTTIETRHASPAKRTKPATFANGKKSKPSGSAPNKADSSGELQDERITKHDRVLSLLNRRDGATIPEMMAATDWQQHSVRGFLAGTVKKKLGFTLTSSKTAGELRRYKIDTKRGR
ncbi:MAG: DUF3489 domain-containing protein [Hyphomicrobium sp.]